MKSVSIVTKPINPITIGKIGSAYGVRGWNKIISFTDKVDDIFQYHPLFILFQSQWKLMQLRSWKLIKKKHYIVQFFNVNDREYAIYLAQRDLIIDEVQLPVLFKHDEYYWKDIIGCKIINITGDFLGYVINIIETAAHDILVVQINKKNTFIKIENYLIPFVQEKIIRYVSLERNIIVVDWEREYYY